MNTHPSFTQQYQHSTGGPQDSHIVQPEAMAQFPGSHAQFDPSQMQMQPQMNRVTQQGQVQYPPHLIQQLQAAQAAQQAQFGGFVQPQGMSIVSDKP